MSWYGRLYPAPREAPLARPALSRKDGMKPWSGVYIVVALVGLVIAPQRARAHILSVIDLNSKIEVNPHSNTGLFDWEVDGVDQLAKQWFWFRIGDEGPEFSLDTLDLVHHDIHGSNMIHLAYAGPLTVNVLYVLMGGPMGNMNGSWLEEAVSITNSSPGNIDLRWFEYTDLDLGGTVDDDLAVFSGLSLTGQLEEDPLTLGLVNSLAPVPTHWEIAFHPSLLGKLNDPFPTTLADATSPLGPGNISQAFQYNFDGLIPNTTVYLLKLKDILLTPIPEPSSWVLLSTGLMGLFGWRRRSTKR